jgi:hypothetical protein
MENSNSPPSLACHLHNRIAATVLFLALWPLCRVDPLLVRMRMGLGKLAFRLLCGAKGARPNGWWRTFYGLNGLLLVLFAIPRLPAVLFVDGLAAVALALVGEDLSAGEVCREVAADLRRVISGGCPVQNLRMAFEADRDAT